MHPITESGRKGLPTTRSMRQFRSCARVSKSDLTDSFDSPFVSGTLLASAKTGHCGCPTLSRFPGLLNDVTCGESTVTGDAMENMAGVLSFEVAAPIARVRRDLRAE